MVEVDAPSAVTGLVPVIVELAAVGPPAVKVTDPSVFATGVRMDSVLVSAVVDAIVQVETPEPLVAEHAPYVLLEPVAEKVGVTDGTPLLLASFRVIVMVEVAAPFAVTGLVPVMVELAATGGPAVMVKEMLIAEVRPALDAV